jgi:hypothetical protein
MPREAMARRRLKEPVYVVSCGQCPACKFCTGEATRLLAEVESKGAVGPVGGIDVDTGEGVD